MHSKRTARLAILLLLSVLVVFTAASAASKTPTIATATVDLGALRLILKGENFGTSPTVLMGAVNGTFDELHVVTAFDDFLEAELTTTEPGTYVVLVGRGSDDDDSDDSDDDSDDGKFTSIDVTIGAAGPTGPEGPQGPMGIQGPPGPPGNLVLAGQTCPADRFVTGFDANGNVVCSCLDFDGDGFSPDGGACGPIDCNDQAAPIFPGAQEVCFDGVDNNCDGEVDESCTGSGQVDIVFVIDNSLSMGEEIAGIEQSINVDLAQVLGASGLDYRIIMLASHGPATTDVCVGPPLSSTSNCSGPPVFSERFFHYSNNVQSHNSLCEIFQTFGGTDPDEFGLAPNGWREWLRADATKVFIEVSDDGTNCSSSIAGRSFNDGNSVAEGKVAADDFDAALLNLSPLHFGAEADRNYLFYSLIGVQELPAGPATPYDATMPVELGECTPGAVDPGTAYQWLSKTTGGLRYPLCDTSVYGAILNGIAADLVLQLQ